jgi:type IV pilus assembly protein PilY1
MTSNNAMQHSFTRRATVVAVLVAMQWQGLAPVWAAEPSQMPLLSTLQGDVPPNFMLVLDNSESMDRMHMPEEGRRLTYSGGTRTLNLAGRIYPLMHAGAGNASRVVPGTPAASASTCYVNELKEPYECWMRSPDVNSIYYDPKTRYRPWWRKDDPTRRMDDAVYTKANLDPLGPSTDENVTDLSKVYRDLTRAWNTKAETYSTQKRDFSPAVFYIRKSDTVNPYLAGSFDKYDLNDLTSVKWGPAAADANLRYGNRTDCDAVCTIQQERQNFANWFTYYRSRMLLTKGALTEAFAPLDTPLRLGWGITSTATGQGSVDGMSIVGAPLQGVRPFTDTHKLTFLSFIQNQGTAGLTPLRYALAGAAKYFDATNGTPPNQSPWREDPGQNSATPVHGCRRSAIIMTTDGYYNDDNDKQFSTTFDKSIYGPDFVDSKGDGDGYSYTLADIAYRYYNTPLVSSQYFANPTSKVNSKNDPATWPHLNQFMLGLGVEGSNATENPGPTTKWPQVTVGTSVANNLSHIDDMIHAAYNSRGKFFSVSKGDELTAAIKDALNPDEPKPLSESGVATGTRSSVAGDVVYEPVYYPNGWYGELRALKIAQSAPDPKTGLIVFTENPLWFASAQRPHHTQRNIVTMDPATGKGIDFTQANLSKFTAIPSANLTSAFVNYIRGDDTTATGTTFRKREKDRNPKMGENQDAALPGKLPDFVDSKPLVVAGNFDGGHELLDAADGGGDAYRTFRTNKQARTPLVFVGGNGGMLHAFNGAESSLNGGGEEIFAYLPYGAQAKLPELAKPDYKHRFYVDGPIQEADAFIARAGSAPQWTNLVIGTMGHGGKSVFAIDATGTTSTSTANNQPPAISSNDVMWELTGLDNDDKVNPLRHLGYVTSAPVVGKVEGGGWYAFIGNGIGGASGSAAMFVVELATGKIARTFELAPSGANTSANGLTGVSLITNAKGEAIGAYAGDLHGQLWRFNFGGASASDWSIAFGGAPMFKATKNGVAQMISAAPVHYKMTQRYGGVSANLVIFGTGRLTYASDTKDQTVQTIYAVMDPSSASDATISSATANPLTNTSPPAGSMDIRDAVLVKQSFQPSVGGKLVQLSKNTVDFKSSYGWYLDLIFNTSNTPGMAANTSLTPKVVYQPTIINSLVYLNAIATPAAGDPCDDSEGWKFAMALPVLNGGQLEKSTWDTNNDNLINGDDQAGQVIALQPLTGEGTITNTDNSKIKRELTADKNGKGIIGTGLDACAAGGPACGDEPPDPDPKGGVIKDRVWRRIINPPQF